MWQRISNPDILIFLDVSFGVSQQRKRLNWDEPDFTEQQNRLIHARQNAHLVIDTDLLTPFEVRDIVLDFLQKFMRQ